jgi:hypothetical protein
MYDRSIKPIPEPLATGLRYRIETLIGITGVKMAKYRTPLMRGLLSLVDVLWRPHVLGILIFEVHPLPSSVSPSLIFEFAARACCLGLE